MIDDKKRWGRATSRKERKREETDRQRGREREQQASDTY